MNCNTNANFSVPNKPSSWFVSPIKKYRSKFEVVTFISCWYSLTENVLMYLNELQDFFYLADI